MAIITWNGNVSTAWSDSSNWDYGVPGSADNIIIPSTTRKPALSGNVHTSGYLYLNSGTRVAINGYHLHVGSLTVEGTTWASIDTGSLEVDGATSLYAGITATGAATFTFTGAVTLTGATILGTTGAGNIVFGSTIDGAYALTVNGSTGYVQFAENVGGSTALSSISTTGSSFGVRCKSVTTSGTQSFSGPMTLLANATFTTTNSTISLGSTVNGAYDLVTNSGTAKTSFGGVIGGTSAPTSLSATSSNASADAIKFKSVSTTGTQTYTGKATVNATSTLTTTNSDITFTSTIDGAYALTFAQGSGDVSITGNVGASTALSSISFSGSGDTSFANITTTGNQSFTPAIVLANDTTLTTSTGLVSFTSTLDGAKTLTIANNTGTVSFGAAVGGTTALTSINISGTGNVTALRDITTVGTQSFTPMCYLAEDVLLTTTDSNVTFTNLVIRGDYTLTTSLGTGSLTMPTSELVSLTVSGSGAISSLKSVRTTGAQAYTGAITLADNAIHTTTDSGVTYSSTINGAKTLTISQGSGAVSFGGVVGGSTALTSLTVSGSGAISSLKSVTTTGAQSFTGAITLADNATLTTTNSNVTISSTVNAAKSLTIAQGSGTVTLGGVIGGTNALTSISITGSGAIQ